MTTPWISLVPSSLSLDDPKTKEDSIYEDYHLLNYGFNLSHETATSFWKISIKNT
jgi:hypothetical protein